MGRHSIWLVPDVAAAVIFNKFVQYRIGLVVDQKAIGFYPVNEDHELLQVKRESGEHVDVIPGYARQYRHMRIEEMELGFLFNGARWILIALANDHGCMCNIDRLFKTLHPCTHQV